ncbi:MAG: SIMPL domain-containing protein [Pseudomonadota bacterium]|nr:SIMPL domain-containing protein [Pseudomonadota bacterium]
MKMSPQGNAIKLSKVLLTGLLCLVWSSPALAQVNALPAARHILVYGEAQARAIPDRFTIALEFEVVDPDADVARRRVESHVEAVLTQLKAAGVPTSEIVATSLRIVPRQRYDEGTREQVFIGTAVSRSLSARFSDQTRLQSFLANITTSKEQKVTGLTTELADEKALREALREKAIESSQKKARVIADAYGASLAGVYSVSDVAPQFEYGIQEGNWPSAYQWSPDMASAGTLDRIQVTGSRAAGAPAAESLQVGYVTFEDRIYAVFLIAD